MYIWKLSELTGASRKAIRLYESMGLIPAPMRKGQYRVYDERDVNVVRMIRRAQEVGFKLAELKRIVEIKVAENRCPIELANRMIALKQQMLKKEMEHLRLMEQRLLELQEEVNLHCS